MKILTFNCCAVPMLAPEVDARLTRMLDEIRRLDPDVVCLQELASAQQAQWLADHFAWRQSYFEKGRRDWTAGGLAVFSKIPFTATSFKPFSKQGPRLGYGMVFRMLGQGFMRLELGSPRTVLYHTHLIPDFAGRFTLTNYGKIQSAQAAELLEALRAERTASRALVVGCLNATPSSDILRKFAELRLGDILGGSEESSVVPEDRFPARLGGRRRLARLDYILDSAGAAQAWWVFDELHGFGDRRSTLSDHRGLLGQLGDA